MRTDDWIDALARSPQPPASSIGARYAIAIGASFAGALLLMAVLLGVRHDLAQAVAAPMFWVKLAFGGAVAAFALPASVRLGRPGARVGALGWGIAAPFAVLVVLGALVLASTEPSARAAMVLGRTWRTCAWLIALLALPGWVATLWAMRGLAPTHAARAGACAGLVAGGIAATVYALHCPELEAPFLAVWYVLGVLLPALAGAVAGRWWLRW